MTDPDLLAQKLAFIETCVQELRTLARPAEILRDVREACRSAGPATNVGG